MNFEYFYLLNEERNENDDWRSRKIWHTTPTGIRSRVKVKSLPSEEQWKYAPLSVKLKRKEYDSTIDIEDTPHTNFDTNRVFKLYYSADRPNGFDEFEEGKLVMASDDSSIAIEIEKKGHTVAIADKVPLNAFKKQWNSKSKKWIDFPKDMTDEEKYELITWKKDDIYLCDFFKFKDQIEFSLSIVPDGNVENYSEE